VCYGAPRWSCSPSAVTTATFGRSNQAFAALLGRRTDEVNGHSVLEFVHPEDLGQVVAAISALERGEPEVLMENRFRHLDGPMRAPIESPITWHVVRL
jgi:PAS domain S-box-containing protein